ncbi:MAG: glycosyltransferase [Armatimonadetes bacterium]|nr:glycosyltransferase [Armatimonadota bacterium]
MVATPLACPDWIQKQPRDASIQSKVVTVLVQGSNWSRKNQAFAIEVFEKLSEKVQCRLLITGKRSVGLPNAEVLGYLPNDAMSGVYARADVLLFPSLHEGFGLPILEGFRTRTLVAASNRGAIPEVAGNGALLFDHFDAARWAAEIQSTLENQSKLQTLLDEGENREKSFTWEATARKTREAYDRTR